MEYQRTGFHIVYPISSVSVKVFLLHVGCVIQQFTHGEHEFCIFKLEKKIASLEYQVSTQYKINLLNVNMFATN